jgi:hypothetical protein
LDLLFGLVAPLLSATVNVADKTALVYILLDDITFTDFNFKPAKKVSGF